MEANGRLQGQAFWESVDKASDPSLFRPQRVEGVEISQLESNGIPYYVLKQPETQSYLRLSEADFALWWQMNGRRTLKHLLFYSLKRYNTLPIGHLNSLITDLKEGGFLTEKPVNLYTQLDHALDKSAPAGRGKRIIEAFLHSEFVISGLDDFFTPLYRQFAWLYSIVGQIGLFLLILAGGGLFATFFFSQQFGLTPQGGLSLISLFGANLVVISIHELAHGLTVKHYGRELHRGGFLLYWGIPAFFVDTRDTWMVPNKARIAVSWAGPYSGLMMGGVSGLLLTAVATNLLPLSLFWTTFVYQIGFIGYFSAFVNLNPLLELDGYFMLMDWLEMPGLRARAFRFWRETAWSRLKQKKSAANFWRALNQPERIFLLYGAISFVYSIYALWLAIFFWQTRISQFMSRMWASGIWGQLLVMTLSAVIIGPAFYYLFHYGWSRIQVGLEWLSRRDLLSRPDVLAVLLGLPMLAGFGLLYFTLAASQFLPVWINLVTWLTHLALAATLISIARQLPGSEFQWSIWSLVGVPLFLALAWLLRDQANQLPRDLILILVTAVIIGAGFAAWLTVGPEWLDLKDRAVMVLMIIGGPLSFLLVGSLYASELLLAPWRWVTTAVVHFGHFLGLMYMAPLLINFRGSRFGLSWFLIVVAIILTPWVQWTPLLHLPTAVIWLFAALHYLVVGALAKFERLEIDEEDFTSYDDRSRLVAAFNAFLRAMFRSYETIFGGRRLALIQAQIRSLGVIDPDASILQISERAQNALLLAVDRLDDLAGTPFTQAAGKAAYDSLPWLQAETLARHVLSGTEWGGQLAEGFIVSRDKRYELFRRADIFAGFDNQAVKDTLEISDQWSGRDGVVLARQGKEATKFFLIEKGEVAILHHGQQVGKLESGGYFGTAALLETGPYQFTYRTLSRVNCSVIHRNRFDPFLRADTTLSRQVQSGAKERQLLKQMPLFSSLSPQQLATVDARLKHQTFAAGETIVEQGQPRSDLFIVVTGAVDVVVQSEEKEHQIGRLGPGEHFGEYALFADTPYQATYRAIEKTELLRLDEEKFDKLVAECDQMSHYVEQIGSGRLVATRRRLGITAVV